MPKYAKVPKRARVDNMCVANGRAPQLNPSGPCEHYAGNLCTGFGNNVDTFCPNCGWMKAYHRSARRLEIISELSVDDTLAVYCEYQRLHDNAYHSDNILRFNVKH